MYEVFKWIWEHRNQPLTWVTVISFLSLIIDKFGRKLITNQLKRLFHVKDKSEFSAYVENQRRIESKVDMLLEERGIVWDAERKNSSINTARSLSISSWVARLFARTVGVCIRKGLTIILRGNRAMKTYLKKLGSRKFQAFLAVTIPNIIIMFGFILGDIDLEGRVNEWMPAINLVIQAITTATYQRAESKVDAATVKGEVKNADFETPVEPRI